MAMKRTVKRVVVRLLVLLAVLVFVFLIVRRVRHAVTGHEGAAHASVPAQAARQAGVPVDVAPVTRRDLPVYLSGLGTVQAYNTVTVRPQVSGQLLRVLFEGGDEVKKGQLLAVIDPRTYQAALDQAKAKLAQDEAQLKTARQDLERFRRLAPEGYVSGQQLDKQKQLVAQEKAAVAADRAAIEADAVQLSYTRITSPIDGRLGMRLVDAGNIVTAGETGGIVVVTQMQPISVVFTLPEQALQQVRAAGPKPPVQALDRSNSTTLATGTLTVIDNQINQSTGTIELKATFPNPDERLWPGQFVNVRMLARTLKQVPVVPVTAVQRGPDGAYVYVLNKDDDTVSMQPVGVGESQRHFTQITHGLTVGQVVVVDGQYHLKPGSHVKARQVTPAAAASSAATAAPIAP